jgi:hypothetical protein
VRYLVCDTDGVLHDRNARSYDDALADVGPEGWDRIGLPMAQMVFGPGRVRLAAFANDCGHLMPEKYPRNMVGSCMLASVGASTAYPYAGPIVFTGWDDTVDDIEVRGLWSDQVAALKMMYADIRVLLGIEPGEFSHLAAPAWRTAILTYAVRVRCAPTPGVTIITGDDALDALTRAINGGGSDG